MRVVERGEREQHFVDGEPDLEPPEELALAELDDEALLEEELDNDDLSEDDVDDEVLAASLEHLVHPDDQGDLADDAPEPIELALAVLLDGVEVDDDDEVDEELDLDDIEQSLDAVLQLRLAEGADADGDDEADGDGPGAALAVGATAPADGRVGPAVPGCGPDEFVCTRCWLVHHRSQRAEADSPVCRDCAD